VEDLEILVDRLERELAACSEQLATLTGPVPVHPILDLAGYLDTREAALYALTGHEAAVLETLEARPAGEGVFEMDLVTVHGTMVPLTFVVVPVENPWLLGQLGADQPDIEPDEEVGIYRIYRNAECKKWAAGNAFPCGRSAPGADEWVKVNMCESHRCYKGSGYCLEIWQVAEIFKYYDDNRCRVMNSQKDHSRYLCKCTFGPDHQD
jgi:hypothetical protein